MQLLLAPISMCAEYSFNCIPVLDSWTDPRNLAWAALYATLLAVILAARPWNLAWKLLGAWVQGALGVFAARAPATAAKQAKAVPSGSEGSSPEGRSDLLARWRFFVLAGLLVLPFLPASQVCAAQAAARLCSHAGFAVPAEQVPPRAGSRCLTDHVLLATRLRSQVLLWIGTFVAERLLYTPSIGFVLLITELMFTWLWPAEQPQAAAEAAGVVDATVVLKPAAGRGQRSTAAGKAVVAAPEAAKLPGTLLRRQALCALVVLVCVLGAVRLMRRNEDW
jgi:hypothetical protein